MGLTRSSARKTYVGYGTLVLAAGLATAFLISPPAAPAAIAFHGTASASWASESTTSLQLSAPSGAVAGDVLIASIGFGKTGSGAQPTVTVPAGWTLVSRTDN